VRRQSGAVTDLFLQNLEVNSKGARHAIEVMDELTPTVTVRMGMVGIARRRYGRQAGCRGEGAGPVAAARPLLPWLVAVVVVKANEDHAEAVGHRCCRSGLGLLVCRVAGSRTAVERLRCRRRWRLPLVLLLSEAALSVIRSRVAVGVAAVAIRSKACWRRSMVINGRGQAVQWSVALGDGR
jgi:hypothetical protein